MFLNEVGNTKYNILSKLQTIFDNDSNNNQLFITFTLHKKFGINPKSSFDTPLGIYAYPLTYVLSRKLDVPYAKNCPYIWVFRSTDCFSLQSKFDISIKNNIISQLDNMNIDVDYTLEDATTNEGVYRGLKRSVRNSTEKVTNVQFRTILISAGIKGIVDNGSGTIHKAEPTQAVFFFVPDLEIISLLQQFSIVKDTPPSETTDSHISFDQYYQNVVVNKNKRNVDIEQQIVFEQPPTEDQLTRFIFNNIMQKGGRIQFLEKYIATSAEASVSYARDVLIRRFRRGENTIKQNPTLWGLYRKQFPEVVYS